MADKKFTNFITHIKILSSLEGCDKLLLVCSQLMEVQQDEINFKDFRQAYIIYQFMMEKIQNVKLETEE